jgi:vancomycin permeability regulator SanA
MISHFIHKKVPVKVKLNQRIKILKLIKTGVFWGVIFYFFACLIIISLGLKNDDKVTDVAVVLGTTVNPDRSLSTRLQARLDMALDLYRQKRVRHIITSGGVGVEGHDEARVMADYLISQGVPVDSVSVDSTGLDTRATAKATALLMQNRGLKSVTAVSQYFHVTRTKLALEQCGVKDVHTAYAVYWELRDIYSVIREVPAYVRYWFEGC